MNMHLLSALSGRDNSSVDIGRVLLLLAVVALIGLEIFQVVVRGTAFDAVSFSGAMVGLLTGGSAALLIKRQTEPDFRPDEHRPPSQ
jgi:hypothetical protein